MQRLDCEVQAPRKIATILDDPLSTVFNQFYRAETSTTIGQSHSVHPNGSMINNQPSRDSQKLHNDSDSLGRGFVIPDLNMMPFEEEPCDIFGMRL